LELLLLFFTSAVEELFETELVDVDDEFDKQTLL